MSDVPNCPCEGFVHPAVIDNQPGLSVIRYRVGDFLSFRHALLLSRPLETQLAHWRPGGRGDLAVQLVEWWAVLADILTFYNERAITQAFIRTADLPEAVNNLVRLLGYRPRPAIAAHGQLAAIISGTKPVTLRKGFAIQSKPGPGKQPQIFETDSDATLDPGGIIEVDPSPDPRLFTLDGQSSSVLLAGTVTSIGKGDRLLLRKRVWSKSGTLSDAVVAVVSEVRTETSPRGTKNTRVVFDSNLGFGTENAADWLLLRGTQTARLFATANAPIEAEFGNVPVDDRNQITLGGAISMTNAQYSRIASAIRATPSYADARFRTAQSITGNAFHLEGTSSIDPDDALMIEQGGDYRIARVLGQTRLVWYANGDPAGPGAVPTLADKEVAIPVLHSVIQTSAVLKVDKDVADWNAARQAVKLTFGWSQVGTLIGTPRTTFDGSIGLIPLSPIPSVTTPAAAFLEDVNGAGASASLTKLSSAGAALGNVSPLPLPLIAPLHLLTGLVSISRGKSVTGEVLGSGDATVAAQQFVLAKSPLTYLQAGESYASTLRIVVDGVFWTEVPSFHGRPPGARVFVTKEDVGQKTHVLFGDGVNGARLPSGKDNVVASYRFGGGAEAPEAGTLNVVLNPQPGLRGIRNPVPMFGGSDPDPADKVRRYAPSSVLTFGRAVSGDDYEVIAAQAPGVRRARAYWTFDPVHQRAMVTVYVGDTPDAVTSARTAILASQDPNRHVNLALAPPMDFTLSLSLRIRDDYEQAPVVALVRSALQDDDAGLFGANIVRIGQVFFDSQIHRACLSVPGVVAVHSLRFNLATSFNWLPGFFPRLAAQTDPRHVPDDGHFFRLKQLDVTPEP
ncbi:MAG TPA: hypothetical protein VN380_12780 [Thermoanaerobaculia bacterium]|jgi:hypothetical protein|nr:hypothetical protein [Thermoanaerobaculia bacterium]